MATPIPQNRTPLSGEEILAATSGRSVGTPLGANLGVATDTREDLRGKVFVALRGENFDAHNYLARAVEAGATTLVVETCAAVDAFLETAPQVAVVIVDDTLTALGDLALFHRNRWHGKLVAVAGSAGKTTTRSVISGLLEAARPGRVHSTRGNLNNRIGVPMTLFGLEAGSDWAVVEVGTNCPGEVAELTRLTRPDVAVLTLIDLEHTEGLGDLDGVEKEERAVFSLMDSSGVAVGFGEDERVLRSVVGARARSATYGFDAERELQIVERRLISESRMALSLRRVDGTQLSLQSPLVGRPGALAVAAGVCAAEALLGEALTAELCEKGLQGVGEPGRNTVVRLTENRWVIDDTYNSNPASVENSVSTGRELAAKTGGKLWLVLGEMLELGQLATESHIAMGKMAANSGAAGAFFIQGEARASAEVAQQVVEMAEFFEESGAVADRLAPLLQPGDVVVVKASRGVRAERVVEGLAARLGLASEAPSEPSGSDS